MKVIPAIDIRGGKVVRLTQGEYDKETVYSDSPIETARRWDAFGVDLIHVVDLDGALTGKLANLYIVKEIAESVRARIELGGGIRDEETIDVVLSSDIEKVVIGTRALDTDFVTRVVKEYKDAIVVAVDAKAGMVYTKGWLLNTKTHAANLVKSLEKSGAMVINYTDISRDGMLTGPNLNALKELLKAVNLDVIASGGVSSIEDVKKLKSLESYGLKGVIIGKALYENKVDLKEAIDICSRKE